MTEKTTVKLSVLIMVPNYWGKADTLAGAWKNVCSESCKTKTELRRGKYAVYIVGDCGDAKSHIDGYGSFLTPAHVPPVKIEGSD